MTDSPFDDSNREITRRNCVDLLVYDGNEMSESEMEEELLRLYLKCRTPSQNETGRKHR